MPSRLRFQAGFIVFFAAMRFESAAEAEQRAAFFGRAEAALRDCARLARAQFADWAPR